MKKYFLLTSMLLCYQVVFCQNVGVNTSTPEAALDVNGDIILRPANLVVADGITLALDVNTSRFSYYRVEGPTADFTIAGITAGIDGRQLTLFNRSGFTMQLNNEDPAVSPADMIVTGTNADITILHKGVINLQYDGNEGKWIVKSSSKGFTGSGGYWDVSGNDIFNTNTGNVGIGTNNPTAKLTIQTDLNSPGWTHIGGNNTIIVGEAIGGVSAAIGTSTEHILRLNAGTSGRIQIIPDGNVVIGDQNVAPYGRLTVRTANNSYGMVHTSNEGNVLGTFIGGTSAGIGTFSNTDMRIFCNGQPNVMFFSAATGNVGIGTNNPTYKLSVLGNIRSTEVVVETGWADYVFDKKYKLAPLYEVEEFINQNKHLPNIPSAAEIESKGLHLGDTQKRMMEKIEELTLYIIQQQKEIDALKEMLQHNH